MGDHDFLTGDLSRLRRGAHEFLRQHAARAGEHQHDGVRWDITLPPDVAGLPAHERFRVHARHEARRLAGAQLYDLDAEVTGQAADLGAAIRQGRHEEAVTLAGHSRVAAASGIDAPAASGFLRWRDQLQPPRGAGRSLPLGAGARRRELAGVVGSDRGDRTPAPEGRQAVTEIDFAYFNYEHGGLTGGHDHAYSSGRGYDFGGLVRVAGDQGRWPHILIMGEGDRYEFAGGEGMWEAAAAMRAAGGRPYVPLACELPREGP